MKIKFYPDFKLGYSFRDYYQHPCYRRFHALDLGFFTITWENKKGD